MDVYPSDLKNQEIITKTVKKQLGFVWVVIWYGMSRLESSYRTEM